MDDNTPDIDLTRRTEPLSLSDISRAFGLSRSAPQKWHKPPVQAAMGGKTPDHKPALHAVAEAIGAGLGPEVLEHPRPRYPVSVVMALGKALGYLDEHGHPVNKTQGKGRWLPTSPTIDPATQKKRYYVNHLATARGTTPGSIEMSLSRGSFTEPDGTDEMGRIFWWTPTPGDTVADQISNEAALVAKEARQLSELAEQLADAATGSSKLTDHAAAAAQTATAVLARASRLDGLRRTADAAGPTTPEK
ncbi:hypothetical protein [Streptomyces sp. NPDC051662]|uniref:hypothetical protein n=1 Tax=Streptomyces sp. NPDC051662 TaxID=3154750 RepID=UPI0034394A2D